MKWIHTFLVLAFLAACTEQATEEQTKLFEKRTETGIDFKNILTENDSLNYFTYGYIYMGGGVSAGDINNDGLIDLFFTGNQVQNKLYLNKGNLQFEDITEQAGIEGDDRWYTGVTMTDVNHDGLLDIYCSVGGKFEPKENQLFVNQGNNTFKEEAKKYGIADVGNSVQSTFFDYDRDGDLDLYVANYPPTNFKAPNHYYLSMQRFHKPHESDHLYRNDGNGFVDVTEEAGVRSFGLSLSATVGDVNGDGWPDLYVSNDFSTPDYFYINNQDGTFSEKGKTMTKNTSFYGMGVDISDFNNDGLLDIFQVDMSSQDNRRAKANMASMDPELFWGTVNAGFHYQFMQNSLQLNNGNLKDSIPDFSNISRIAGISSTDWSWGPLFADLDNDGWKDLFISNGTRREINNNDYFNKINETAISKDSLLSLSMAIPSEPIDNFVYRNKQDLTFEQANEAWGLSFEGFSNGGVYVDLDNDGDLEIVTNNIDDTATIFENKGNTNGYVALKFKGPKLNPLGIGAKVTAFSQGELQYQELIMSRGFQSSVAPRMHFGMGERAVLDSLKIQWPDGRLQWMKEVAVNQLLEISYVEAIGQAMVGKADHERRFFETVTDSTWVPSFVHKENVFDDFKWEILLPHKMSTLGPALAKGDLNGDGLDDLVLGGAKDQETAVFYQTPTGWERQSISVLENDKEFEDMGALIFDADSDGDNDLYMVSGGNEVLSDSPRLQDRLFINQGAGVFKKSIEALPEMLTSGARVHPFDYDKDGDLDLFVGGRQVPKAYPSPPKSYVLENRSEDGTPRFVDVTPEKAPGLDKIGMVTDASWADYDNDGWVDLILTGEWMPITVFKNNQGRFEEVTEAVGLKDTSGWWFSIASGDFDKDGDVDFVVGNLGLNYKYKANEKESFDIYYNDFDKSGSKDIVLSYFNGGKKYPLRGRECSSQQMPGIKRKFGNYADFSVATLEDVYTEEYLENSLHYQVKSFASVYLENKNGRFVTHKLPNMAQLSSINQILVEDFDKDSNLDVLIIGNLHGSEVETPRNDASNGLLLLGDGKGEFDPMTALESGFFVNGDAKDMTKINIDGGSYIIAVKNNAALQVVKIR